MLNNKSIPYYKPLLLDFLEIRGKKLFLYAGVIGYAQGFEVIINAAKILEDKNNIVFMLVGDGPEKSRLKKIKLNKKNVIFHDSVSVAEMPKFFSVATASIVPLRKIELFKGAHPSKILPSLLYATPVIFSGEGEGANLINEASCGIVVEPENPEALADAVVKLAENESLANHLGFNGRKFVEECSWSNRVDDWLKELTKRIN